MESMREQEDRYRQTTNRLPTNRLPNESGVLEPCGACYSPTSMLRLSTWSVEAALFGKHRKRHY